MSMADKKDPTGLFELAQDLTRVAFPGISDPCTETAYPKPLLLTYYEEIGLLPERGALIAEETNPAIGSQSQSQDSNKPFLPPVPDMIPLFQEARGRGLWIQSLYQDLWFTPDELEHQQSIGKFRWGVVNWKLKHPSEQVAYLKVKAEGAKKEYEDFNSKVESYYAK